MLLESLLLDLNTSTKDPKGGERERDREILCESARQRQQRPKPTAQGKVGVHRKGKAGRRNDN